MDTFTNLRCSVQRMILDVGYSAFATGAGLHTWHHSYCLRTLHSIIKQLLDQLICAGQASSQARAKVAQLEVLAVVSDA